MFDNFRFGRSRLSPKQPAHNASEKAPADFTVVEVTLVSPMGSPKTVEPQAETKRKMSLADLFRRGSTNSTAAKSDSDSPSPTLRNGSVGSLRSPFWESRNPDYDSADLPRNKSVVSNASTDQMQQYPTGRRPSFQARNAAASFRRTTTRRDNAYNDPATNPTADLAASDRRRGSVNINGRSHSLVTTPGAQKRRGSIEPRPAQDRSVSLSAMPAPRRPSSINRASFSMTGEATRPPSSASSHSRRPGSTSGGESPKRQGSYVPDAGRMMSVDEGDDGEVVEEDVAPVTAALEALGFRGAVPV